jgi:ATP-dependent Clp protease ATP-binding subunit ClpX
VRERDLDERRGYHDSLHPAEEEFTGHSEVLRGMAVDPPASVDNFYVPEDMAVPEHVKIDKSNLLLIGPTGVGKTYILE